MGLDKQTPSNHSVSYARYRTEIAVNFLGNAVKPLFVMAQIRDGHTGQMRGRMCTSAWLGWCFRIKYNCSTLAVFSKLERQSTCVFSQLLVEGLNWSFSREIFHTVGLTCGWSGNNMLRTDLVNATYTYSWSIRIQQRQKLSSVLLRGQVLLYLISHQVNDKMWINKKIRIRGYDQRIPSLYVPIRFFLLIYILSFPWHPKSSAFPAAYNSVV